MKKTLAGLAIILAGCSGDEIRDVDYYVKHSPERTAQLAKCDGNPGKMGLEPNCINASKALWKAGMLSGGMPSLQ